jgi:hypothetical protein
LSIGLYGKQPKLVIPFLYLGFVSVGLSPHNQYKGEKEIIMKIKKLIEQLKLYNQDTEINFVMYSGNEDTDSYDLPIKYIGEIDTSLLDGDIPKLTVGFKSPYLKYSYKKSWSFKGNLN